MPIHRRPVAIQSELLHDVYYACNDTCCSSPRVNTGSDEYNPRNAYIIICDELLLDGNVRQNVASFCTRWMEPEVRRLMLEGADKNLIDKDQHPQTAEIEGRCVHILADLWNAPKSASPLGCSTTGSLFWPAEGIGFACI